MNSTFLVRLLVVGLLGVTVAAAQSIISARAGAIHHVEGVVLMDSEPIVLEFAKFPNLPEGSVLETGLGRAEMLLTPGVIIRLSEESSVKMLNAGLDNTQLEFQGGSALVEAMEILDGNAVSIRHGDAIIAIERAGLYRLDSDPAELRVYRGRAKVVKDDQVVVAKKGKIVELAPFLTATKFDANQNDSLYRWSARRSSYLASANLSAAAVDRSVGIVMEPERLDVESLLRAVYVYTGARNVLESVRILFLQPGVRFAVFRAAPAGV